MVTTTGIFTLYPSLTSFANSYNFTDDQKMQDTLNSMEETMNQVEISQFTNEEGGKRYVICLANDYIYFMNEKGALFNHFKIYDLDALYTISLVSYIYSDGNYYFVIAYNSGESLNLRFYKIFKQNNKYEMILIIQSQLPQTINGNNYLINPSGISCHAMKTSTYGKVLTCLESIKYQNKFAAFTFKPDNNNFDLLFMNNDNSLSNYENKDAIYIKSSLNNDKAKALICYSVNNPDAIKCISYNINTRTFNDVSLFVNICNVKYFGYGIYYFDKINEYVLTCIDINNDKFHFLRLRDDYSINLDADEKSFLNQNTFLYCNTYDISSVIYVSKYK